jgi:hypothetical protein
MPRDARPAAEGKTLRRAPSICFARLTHWGDGVRKAISIVVAALLAVSIVATIVVWAAGSPKKPLQIVRGVIGSDDKEFFSDPRVRAAFATRGLDLKLTTVVNAQIASTVHRSKSDFAFGAGIPDVQQILSTHSEVTSTVPFFTPMAVATSTDIAQLLERAGVAHHHGGWWTLDMKRFLDLVARHVRWNQLAGNAAYSPTDVVRITSTDVTTESSAEAYASIASYVANQDRVLGSAASVDQVVNQVSPLFLEQNHKDQSTEVLFQDYLSRREGPTAMVMISEAQFVARAAARHGSIRPNMVLMYPSPDVLSKYTLVPLSSAGDTVGRLLTDDPSLRQLAVEHGFRITSKPQAFDSLVKHDELAVPPQVPDLIEPPTEDILRALMTRIDAALHVALGPLPGPTASVE